MMQKVAILPLILVSASIAASPGIAMARSLLTDSQMAAMYAGAGNGNGNGNIGSNNGNGNSGNNNGNGNVGNNSGNGNATDNNGNNDGSNKGNGNGAMAAPVVLSTVAPAVAAPTVAATPVVGVSPSLIGAGVVISPIAQPILALPLNIGLNGALTAALPAVH